MWRSVPPHLSTRGFLPPSESFFHWGTINFDKALLSTRNKRETWSGRSRLGWIHDKFTWLILNFSRREVSVSIHRILERLVHADLKGALPWGLRSHLLSLSSATPCDHRLQLEGQGIPTALESSSKSLGGCVVGAPGCPRQEPESGLDKGHIASSRAHSI